jgi:FkbM family methyltransferase
MSIRDVGLSIVRSAPWLNGVGRWVYQRLPDSLRDTPASLLKAHFRGKAQVTFVQIGAYDGVADDPIRPLILNNERWSGVLVEPQPDAFERLKRNYPVQASRLQLLNIAISDTSGEKAFFYIPEAERDRLRLPEWIGRVASFSAQHLREHLSLHEIGAHAAIVSSSVRTMTFSEVAEKLPGGHVDVIVIDAEGHEGIILDAIDLDRHGVQFIVYEHEHLSERDRLAAGSKLLSHGFSLNELGRDTIARRSGSSVCRRVGKPTLCLGDL